MGFRDVVSFLFEDSGQTTGQPAPVHVQQPVGVSGQPGMPIWILRIQNYDFSDEFWFPCSSKEMANLALEAFIDRWWTYEGLEEPLPKTFQEKVEAYFDDHMDGQESYEIVEANLDDLSSLTPPEPKRMRF